MEPDIK